MRGYDGPKPSPRKPKPRPCPSYILKPSHRRSEIVLICFDPISFPFISFHLRLLLWPVSRPASLPPVVPEVSPDTQTVCGAFLNELG